MARGNFRPDFDLGRLSQFQSAPGLMARGNLIAAAPDHALLLFQSAPGLMARGNVAPLPMSSSNFLFQSAPGLMARGNVVEAAEIGLCVDVSIRPRPDGQGKLVPLSTFPKPRRFQSAP